MVSISRNSLLTLILVIAASAAAFGQGASGATDIQRINIMESRLDQMKRSLSTAISALKDDGASDNGKKSDGKRLDTPLGRLQSLEKDVSKAQSDITSLRGKIDRGDKYDSKDVDDAEQTVKQLQASVDTAQLETASARANSTADGKGDTKKGKKKFLGIFGGGGSDEYQDLLGTVSAGRDRELFVNATKEIRKKNYDVGRLLLQTIITTYPDSPYLPMSKLAIGDSFYLEDSSSSLIQAIAAYQDWLTFFPTHPLSCRVIMKIAESEMRQVGLPDRDATHAHRAETRLKALLQQCSEYPVLEDEAKTRLNQVQDNLGLHNLLVANYYYALAVDQKKGGLKGAQSRYREIIDKYPNFEFMDEVMYKLAVTYLVEEETDQAARYFQKIVADYPNSDWVDKSKEQLKLIGATIPEPNPDRLKVMPPEDVSFFTNFKNQLFGIYPMTIDRNGVLMTKNFDKEKFELIDQIIENKGDIQQNQIPKALTTVISQQPESAKTPAPQATPQN